MTIGSLFSGIGGLELGLERAGLGPVVWQVEIDPFCRQVLTKHWPDAERFEDVKTVRATNLTHVDIICGGFPCQDISYAGKGEGIGGSRSGLWFEFARIIREMGPRFAVMENVSALLNRGMGDVLGTLASIGYDAIWDHIPASSIGANHQRDRVFIIAYPGSVRLNARWSRESLSRSWLAGQERMGTTWESEPDICRVVDGVPDRVDRIRALGNAVVPQCGEIIGCVIRGLEMQR